MLTIFIRPQLAAAVLGLGMAGLAVAAPLSHKSTTMQCADRRIEIEADCFKFAAYTTLCTRQSIRFVGPGGKSLNARVFQSAPLKNADYPVVADKFGELSCVETADKQKFLVALMDNGGNCEECEWNDVYSTDGVLLGSTRDRKPRNAAVDSAVAAAYDKKARRVLGRQSLTNFYQDSSAR